jgi:hypothetical protein
VTITAIDTSGGIACSRTSGLTPAFVQVSASEIKAAGTDTPYEDLEYEWDFGDPQGKEIFRQPVTGEQVNANQQSGPEAAYCYRKPGTYTVTLRIRGRNGNNYVTATHTQQFTANVYKPRSEFWFDSVNGNDNNSGRSPDAPKRSMEAFNRLMGNDTAFHLKAGCTWSGATGIQVVLQNCSRVRIDRYGDGASPVIMTTTDKATPLVISNGGKSLPVPKDDIVISGITFKIPKTAIGSLWGTVVHIGTVLNAQASMTNIYLDHCTMTTDAYLGLTVVSLQYAQNSKLSRCGIWGGEITSPKELAPPGGKNNPAGFYSGAREWMFFVGFEIYGSGRNNVLDHHMYPDVQNHALFRWINFGEGKNRNFCINTNFNSDKLDYASYYLIAECYMSGTQRAHDASNSTNDPTTVLFRDFVSQHNAYTGLAGDGILNFFCGKSMTQRDNLVWNCNGGRFWAPAPGNQLRAKIYRNKIYQTTGAPVFDYISQLVPWSQPQVITDNIIYITAPAPQIVAAKIGEQVAAHSIIDRNQYWVPNAVGGANARIMVDRDGGKTIAQWQAAGFDRNSRFADPKWPDPATGKFS